MRPLASSDAPWSLNFDVNHLKGFAKDRCAEMNARAALLIDQWDEKELVSFSTSQDQVSASMHSRPCHIPSLIFSKSR